MPKLGVGPAAGQVHGSEVRLPRGSPEGSAKGTCPFTKGLIEFIRPRLRRRPPVWQYLVRGQVHRLPDLVNGHSTDQEGAAPPRREASLGELVRLVQGQHARRPEVAETLISHSFPIDEADRAFAVAADMASGAIKVVVEV